MLVWTEYTRFIVALFAILTPFAAIPIFLSLTQGKTSEGRAATARAAVLTVAAVLVGSALAGDVILTLIGASLDSFRVGGGIVLLLMALSMLSARVSAVQHTPAEATEAEERSAIGVVPLGIPLLAGPGAISTVIIEMQRGSGFWHGLLVLLVILVVCGLLWVALRLAVPLGQWLGTIGLPRISLLD